MPSGKRLKGAHFGLDRIAHIDGIAARLLINDKQGGRVAIEERFDTVLAAAESHVSNIAQPNLLAFGSGGDNDVAELLRIVDLGRHGHRIGISHVARSGFPAELARRKDAALRFDSRKTSSSEIL